MSTGGNGQGMIPDELMDDGDAVQLVGDGAVIETIVNNVGPYPGVVETTPVAAQESGDQEPAAVDVAAEPAAEIAAEEIPEPEEMAAPALPETGHWPVDADTYHADRTAVSSSTIKKFRASPLAYYEEIILGNRPQKEPSEALEFGKAFHCQLLEPEKFHSEYIYAPEFINGEKIDKRKKAHKEFWEDFERAAAGKTLLKWDWKAKIERMISRFMDNPAAAEALTPEALREYPVRFFCEGLQCKAMFDILIPTKDITLNIKTCSTIDQDELSRDIYNYDYHVAAALYNRAYFEVFGRELKEHRFVWCNKEGVNEVLVTKVDPVSMKIGEHELKKAISDLIQSLEFDTFQIPGHGQVVELGLPYWAINRYNLAKLNE